MNLAILASRRAKAVNAIREHMAAIAAQMEVAVPAPAVPVRSKDITELFFLESVAGFLGNLAVRLAAPPEPESDETEPNESDPKAESAPVRRGRKPGK